MKRSLLSAASICLLSLFAAGCANNKTVPELSDEISETESADEFTETEATEQITEKTIETEASSTRATDKENPREAVSDTVQAQLTQELPLIIDLDSARNDGSEGDSNIFFINDNLLCQTGSYLSDDGKSVIALYFFDINSLSFIKAIDIPDGWGLFRNALPSDNPDVLLRYKIWRLGNEGEDEYGLMTIFKDYSYEIKEQYEYSDEMNYFSGHRVFLQPDGIYLADGTVPEKIAEFQTNEIPCYIYPINGGFVYSIMDVTDPFGKCPLSTYTYSFDGSRQRIESLDDAYIISSAGDRLFSYKHSSRDYTMLYVTDLISGSTEVLSETEFETGRGISSLYAATSDGSKILCAANKSGDDAPSSSVYILDADSGEIIDVHRLPEEFNFNNTFYSISCINYGGKEIAAIEFPRKKKKIYLFDI